MGWTHHWKRETELAADGFGRAAADCSKLIPRLGVSLAGFGGNGEPHFGNDAIVLNGAAGQGCETFEIHPQEFDRMGRKEFWSSCKTERAPYDICVKVALIILKHHLADAITVASDGKDADWDDARRICHEALGYGTEFQLFKE